MDQLPSGRYVVIPTGWFFGSCLNLPSEAKNKDSVIGWSRYEIEVTEHDQLLIDYLRKNLLADYPKHQLRAGVRNGKTYLTIRSFLSLDEIFARTGWRLPVGNKMYTVKGRAKYRQCYYCPTIYEVLHDCKHKPKDFTDEELREIRSQNSEQLS